MAKIARFTPKNTADGWRVNIPAKYSSSGKRERHFFPTQVKALEAVANLKANRETHGTQSRAIAPSLAEQAISAVKLLEPLGVSLLDAVRQFVETETRNLASLSIEDALDAFKASRDRKETSAKQSQAYRLRAEKLTQDFAGRTLSTITGEELQEHLSKTTSGPGAFNQNLRLIRAFWRWCAKPPRKWCEVEPVTHLEAAESISSEIGTLTAKQATAIMRAAEKHFPETVPAFAIALFTGMRQQEIDRLQVGDVTGEGITVPATSAKTKRRRFIQMPEPLAAWLAEYPIGESVTPPDWNRKQKAVRRHAGFKVWCDLITPHEPPADLTEWPSNALRHTAATVAIALGKPIEQLVFEHGHVGGLEMLRRHYIGAMPKAEAIKIWAIGPHGKKLPNIAVA